VVIEAALSVEVQAVGEADRGCLRVAGGMCRAGSELVAIAVGGDDLGAVVCNMRN
jgi:hypothetical protein